MNNEETPEICPEGHKREVAVIRVGLCSLCAPCSDAKDFRVWLHMAMSKATAEIAAKREG